MTLQPYPASRLRNKVAIVTGASSEIGLAIIELFASQGCSIVATDFNPEDLHSHFPADSSRQPASARVDGRVVGIPADATDRGQWDKLVRTAKERFGGLDVVINNAITVRRCV